MSYIYIYKGSQCLFMRAFVCFHCVLWPYCLLTLVHVFFRGLGSLPSGKKQSLSVQAIGAWGLRSSCETIIWLEQLEQETLNSLNSTWMICWYLIRVRLSQQDLQHNSPKKHKTPIEDRHGMSESCSDSWKCLAMPSWPNAVAACTHVYLASSRKRLEI